jgi:hypothetical protein
MSRSHSSLVFSAALKYDDLYGSCDDSNDVHVQVLLSHFDVKVVITQRMFYSLRAVHIQRRRRTCALSFSCGTTALMHPLVFLLIELEQSRR